MTLRSGLLPTDARSHARSIAPGHFFGGYLMEKKDEKTKTTKPDMYMYNEKLPLSERAN